MGGCASKPKGFDDMLPKPLPVDAQISPKEVEIDAKPPAEEADKAQPEPANVVVDEKINETPLVVLSEPKQEDAKAEPEAPVSVNETETEPKATVDKTTGPVETKVEPEPVSKVESKNEDPAPLVTL